MLSAVAYELIPASDAGAGWGIGVGLLIGALASYISDRVIDSRGR
jgi:hypothetical protein